MTLQTQRQGICQRQLRPLFTHLQHTGHMLAAVWTLIVSWMKGRPLNRCPLKQWKKPQQQQAGCAVTVKKTLLNVKGFSPARLSSRFRLFQMIPPVIPGSLGCLQNWTRIFSWLVINSTSEAWSCCKVPVKSAFTGGYEHDDDHL